MVKIQFFGAVAEATGQDDLRLDITDTGSSLVDLVAYLNKKYPSLESITFQVALNHQIEKDAVIKEGDEIALLPPFAGG